MSEENMKKELPHSCNCNKVTNCHIFTHPSQKVQDALNLLMAEMAVFDDETNSRSTLAFRSIHKDGIFISISRQAQEIEHLKRIEKL